ncbi:MAG: hypothetical protein LW630_00860 [Saprospiraceae bacterium]|nr:hypothetical protein [Saprospiraceae bacterium]
MSEESKIQEVTAIFRQTLVQEYTAQLVEAYRDLALSHLEAAHVLPDEKKALQSFIGQFIARES